MIACRAEPRLPQEVRALGIQVTEGSAGFLEVITLSSKTGKTSPVEMGNFAENNIRNELRRIDGVGDVQLFGSPYAMRIWLDPQKLAGYNLSASEALAAVQEQNSQTAGGSIGAQPLNRTAEFTAQIITQNRFATPEQFRQIIIRANPDGSAIRLGDVARVELGKDNYGFRLTLNGKETVGLAVQLASGANALATAEAVSARMKALQSSFPADVTWSVPFTTTPFITASVDSVIHTLVEAMILVFLVMFLFLQNWRATLIPAIVVPIALGAPVSACWPSASRSTRCRCSAWWWRSASGRRRDRRRRECRAHHVRRGAEPRRATVKAMGQITGAIIGITLVLVAVFIPMAFFRARRAAFTANSR